MRNIGDERDLRAHHVAHAPAVDAHVDELRAAADDGRRAVVLQLVADVDHHVWIFREVERGEPGGGLKPTMNAGRTFPGSGSARGVSQASLVRGATICPWLAPSTTPRRRGRRVWRVQ